jgi:hypothetical protein
MEPGVREDAEPDRGRIDDGLIAADDAASLELLHPLVDRRPADPDLRPDVGIGPAPIRLQQVEDPGVDPVDDISLTHIR